MNIKLPYGLPWDYCCPTPDPCITVSLPPCPAIWSRCLVYCPHMGQHLEEFMALIVFTSKNRFTNTFSGEWEVGNYALTPILHWYKLSFVDLTASYLGCYCIWLEWHSKAPRKEKLGDEIVTWVRKPQWSLRTVYHSYNCIIEGKRGYCPESATDIPSFTSLTKIILVINCWDNYYV